MEIVPISVYGELLDRARGSLVARALVRNGLSTGISPVDPPYVDVQVVAGRVRKGDTLFEDGTGGYKVSASHPVIVTDCVYPSLAEDLGTPTDPEIVEGEPLTGIPIRNPFPVERGEQIIELHSTLREAGLHEFTTAGTDLGEVAAGLVNSRDPLLRRTGSIILIAANYAQRGR